jgi:hypothetical protein
MVYCEVLAAAAVNAPITIPLEYIFPGKGDMPIWHRHIPQKPNNPGPGVVRSHGSNLPSGMALDDFGFAEINQDESPPPGGNMNGLIVIVEHQDGHGDLLRQVTIFQGTKVR